MYRPFPPSDLGPEILIFFKATEISLKTYLDVAALNRTKDNQGHSAHMIEALFFSITRIMSLAPSSGRWGTRDTSSEAAGLGAPTEGRK